VNLIFCYLFHNVGIVVVPFSWIREVHRIIRSIESRSWFIYLFYLSAVQTQYRNIRLILRSGDESFVLAGDVAEAQGIHASLDLLQFHNGLPRATCPWSRCRVLFYGKIRSPRASL
jgi:hypothetical protein